MTAKLNRPIITLLGGFLALGTVNVWAVKFPLSPEELNQQANYVITGLVVEITSKDRVLPARLQKFLISQAGRSDDW